MKFDTEKLLKSAEYMFEGDKSALQAIDYIRFMMNKFGTKIPDTQNALVQIHSPDSVLISEADLNKLKGASEQYNDLIAKYNTLVYNYDQLSQNYDQLYNQYHIEVERLKEELQDASAIAKEAEHLKKSKGMCQLDSAGVCTYCDKRVIVANINSIKSLSE